MKVRILQDELEESISGEGHVDQEIFEDDPRPSSPSRSSAVRETPARRRHGRSRSRTRSGSLSAMGSRSGRDASYRSESRTGRHPTRTSHSRSCHPEERSRGSGDRHRHDIEVLDSGVEDRVRAIDEQAARMTDIASALAKGRQKQSDFGNKCRAPCHSATEGRLRAALQPQRPHHILPTKGHKANHVVERRRGWLRPPTFSSRSRKLS